jgi:hypothetical protein
MDGEKSKHHVEHLLCINAMHQTPTAAGAPNSHLPSPGLTRQNELSFSAALPVRFNKLTLMNSFQYTHTHIDFTELSAQGMIDHTRESEGIIMQDAREM